ncbi:alpha-ketoglutarate-dependent dioxygenase alkB homolog 3 isoform X3 [Anguilla anguilla]|uniref:alpha-ketoglutarate-dependent dioxygenase alkB homolog 3 isoform X3 n=1 Tax=Anguilla anguilla TaxID=7936 RepID=UPI0015AE1992|nr:alpha-ketoglutarate-dependent dioxygenase alkB homolog 3 isoform X3 [Anguilla anguilla]
MSDRRQRARVQGSWAPSRPKPATRPAGGAEGFVRSAAAPSAHSSSWGDGGQAFEFHPPAKPLRDVPAEKVIEQVNMRLATAPRVSPGQAYEEPRLTCWYGELPYTYSNSTLQPNTQWPAVLADLKAMVEQVSGSCFNSLLCNLYRDGKDSIAWHSDSELSLGPHPAIASLSLGDTRCFSMRKQPRPEESGDYTYVEKLKIPLSHGTLLLMEGATQEDWQHQVAKEYHDRGPRVNLTFRTVYPEPEPEPEPGRNLARGPRS